METSREPRPIPWIRCGSWTKGGCAYSMRMPKGPIGARSRGSFCASTRSARLFGRGRPSIVASRAPSGFQGMDTVTCFDVAGLALMPDKGKAQLTMFEMAINRSWGRWDWTVSERTGKVIVFGREMSRSAARYQAARALFQLLLAVGTYNS